MNPTHVTVTLLTTVEELLDLAALNQHQADDPGGPVVRREIQAAQTAVRRALREVTHP